METISKSVGAVVIAILVICAVAVVGGTILWACWDGLLAMFPKAVSSGVLAEEISWWDAVKATWVFGVLFKVSGSNSKKD
tara:strand:+ start:339 stop:578 length:240 start_codon:yes stop_codon:yes gene_type:complete